MFVGVTGHQDIPPSVKSFVRDRIAEVLSNLKGNVTGVSSLASGADQLFATVVVGMGAQLHAVIPCAGYESTFTNQKTLNRYHNLLQQANTVEVLGHQIPSPSAFLDAGRRVVDLSNIIIAVWDGCEARGAGGTADIVGYTKERGKHVVVVWPSGVSRGT